MERKLRQEWENQGLKLPPETAGEAFDSNVITPGTPFMANLSIALQYYIHQKMNTDSAWKDIKVYIVLISLLQKKEKERKVVFWTLLNLKKKELMHNDPGHPLGCKLPG